MGIESEHAFDQQMLELHQSALQTAQAHETRYQTAGQVIPVRLMREIRFRQLEINTALKVLNFPPKFEISPIPSVAEGRSVRVEVTPEDVSYLTEMLSFHVLNLQHLQAEAIRTGNALEADIAYEETTILEVIDTLYHPLKETL